MTPTLEPNFERLVTKHALWIAMVLLVSACSGGSSTASSSSAPTGNGGGSSSVTGLALPSNVSVVTANNAG